MSIYYDPAKSKAIAMLLLLLLCFMLTAVDAQTPVDTSGWNPDDGTKTETPKSWLEKNGRIAFVVVIGVVLLSLIIFYIVRSVRTMRKRLKQENEDQLHVIQQMSTVQQHPPPLHHTLPTQLSVESNTSSPQRY
ncbi:hypothetical protein BX666DRAFT_2029711 [Dichotomocladium elegans]|nr:hypothetical protein BX666DRAFT_2029711 [Dichotomocladium elegans]